MVEEVSKQTNREASHSMTNPRPVCVTNIVNVFNAMQVQDFAKQVLTDKTIRENAPIPSCPSLECDNNVTNEMKPPDNKVLMNGTRIL